MTLSPNGLFLIQDSEGFVNHIYPDAEGFSIGYGTHLDTPELISKYQNVILTKQQATTLMLPKITISENTVNQHVVVSLTQNQFDALIDFTYNLGTGALLGSTLLKLLNQGDYQGAADEFPKWDISNGKILAGLLARRNREKLLFLT